MAKWTRFSVPVSIFRFPDDFFLTRNEKEKFVKGAKWIQGVKTLLKNRKKEYEKQAHF